jgi:hypothetical protein
MGVSRLFYLALNVLWISQCQAQDLLASLDYGNFQGTYNARYNISYWRKIPFAAPPVGENRFRAPQPPIQITNGTYNSDQSYDFCPQRTVRILFMSPFQVLVKNSKLFQMLIIKLGQRHRRLPLPRPILPTLERTSTPPTSRSRLLRWRLHPRRRLLHHPTSRLPSPQRLKQQQFHFRLPQLPSQRIWLPLGRRNRSVSDFRL